MSRGRQYIDFKGLFANNVLGTFRIIRGFADLRDLAAVSVPYQMTDGEQPAQVAGHQRELNPKHAEDIKNYLEKSDNRFLPEIILSLRCELEDVVIDGTVVGVWDNENEDVPIFVRRRYSSKTMRMQTISVPIGDLEDIKTNKVFRRIDGNHRLALAEHLEEDEAVPTKYLAPFCIVLLGTADNDADDFAESLIFHTINSSALPLESEHGLRLLLGQDPAHAMLPDNEFSYSPELHLTRLLADRLQRLTPQSRQRFGERPLTALWDSARNLIAMDSSIAQDRNALTAFADDLFSGLADVATRLTVNHPSMCRTYGFFELAARVWRQADGDEHDEKVLYTVEYLDRIGNWLGAQGITSLLNQLSPAQQLLETFNAAQSRIPKRVFLARWYPGDNDGAEKAKADNRLNMIQGALGDLAQEGVNLELDDPGTVDGGTFGIHAMMYSAIANDDIIIVDLSGLRHNVCIEAGYALSHHNKGKLLFIFQATESTEGNPAAYNNPPFDLTTYRYERIEDTGATRPVIVRHIREIMHRSQQGHVN